MKEQLEKFENQLKNLVIAFYNASGAKQVDVNIRVNTYEETHKVALEFYGCENRDLSCKSGNPGCCKEN